MYMDDIKLFTRNEKELEILIHAVRIYSQDIGMEFSIEKCAMLIRKNEKRYMTEGMELPKQEKIRTLGEKETYKYLGILEVDTIKQVEMKEKLRKRISGENCSRQKYIAGPYQRDKYPGSLPRQIFGTILKVDQRRI